MVKVAILTDKERDSILNLKYDDTSFFNPIRDIDGNWVISKEEINDCINERFSFLKSLKLITHKPIMEAIQE
tara:strand:+ start:123 stop:338 length:216 start_codon:yes stop_codon:yes gene_type:complete